MRINGPCQRTTPKTGIMQQTCVIRSRVNPAVEDPAEKSQGSGDNGHHVLECMYSPA
ncbi:MAG: hypothetical protein KGH89_00990 [Thaumarchaeota archaeon]|nr:hypothetical protein [Nitrososphaerota archaeon]MDE1866989.1 hypothetical protein [Nitrososphaerota archaeon]